MNEINADCGVVVVDERLKHLTGSDKVQVNADLLFEQAEMRLLGSPREMI